MIQGFGEYSKNTQNPIEASGQRSYERWMSFLLGEVDEIPNLAEEWPRIDMPQILNLRKYDK